MEGRNGGFKSLII